MQAFFNEPKKHLYSSQIPYQTQDSQFVILFCLLINFFRAAPSAYGSSRARGRIRAAAAGLHHSNSGSELHLRPISQLLAMLDP